MSSPFPGMDPYLEARSIWPGVHLAMVTYIHENLQPQLQPKYIARIEERIQLAQISQNYVPDVIRLKTLRESTATYANAQSLVADEPQIATTPDEAYHEAYIEIVARESGDVVLD